MERQLLERDIHDGAQQQLVALAVNIRLVQSLLPRSPHQAGELLEGLDRSVEQAAADLLEVVGGRPRLLAQAGLTAALRAAADTSPLPVELVSSGLGRYSADVELALYFCCLEALQNVAKHAAAHAVRDRAARRRAERHRVCRDDGRGFDVPGSSEGGLAHMAERIGEVGGALSIRSEPPRRDDRAGRGSAGRVGCSRREGVHREAPRLVAVHRDCGTRHRARRPGPLRVRRAGRPGGRAQLVPHHHAGLRAGRSRSAL